MNIIRSKVVELNTIPAIAYKIKLKTGGSGIKFHRTDRNDSAFAEIDKRTGDAQLDPRAAAELFPAEALEEAVEELMGCPYSARGKVKVVISDDTEDGAIEVPEDEAPGTHSDSAANAVDSDEFIAIADMYTDASGKMNYKLMNKQFIQFAARNKTVADMVSKKESEEAILLHIIKNRAAFIAGKKDNLSDEETLALIEAMEDVHPRSAFKDLKLHIRKMLAR